jgi:hypothetical protein
VTRWQSDTRSHALSTEDRQERVVDLLFVADMIVVFQVLRVVRPRLRHRDVSNCRALSLGASHELLSKTGILSTTSRLELCVAVESNDFAVLLSQDTSALSICFADPLCLLGATDAVFLVKASAFVFASLGL